MSRETLQDVKLVANEAAQQVMDVLQAVMNTCTIEQIYTITTYAVAKRRERVRTGGPKVIVSSKALYDVDQG